MVAAIALTAQRALAMKGAAVCEGNATDVEDVLLCV